MFEVFRRDGREGVFEEGIYCSLFLELDCLIPSLLQFHFVR
jgi:hypothetical protein